ncbi:class I SAM-dependent methyltransferase [Nodosilinea sp. E11]|uniref:class I SAM-dependent methyltransferase n=1 Tax=Nodosilinea sp. E11 TaxID=3037479 RepID=UPI0029342B0C|nr:class I SAM-dependent methyltransferase [Nodosilinea sp. E11]WOD40922.1 class I SAM-dependent methyltransferase [Nodosilinea sp. E11]
MFRRVTPGTISRLTTVDHRETYGRHVLAKVVQPLAIDTCVDLGCGGGDDLKTVLAQHPQAHCVGVDYGDWNSPALIAAGIKPISVNIEAEPLPLAPESVDLVIANQVLEHTKEIYWINHEIFRVLKVGGYLYLGVPNVLSLHNRLLGLVGVHPTCNKMISAHVRPFSKGDTLLFYRETVGNLTVVSGFYGSQFYPFPRQLARPLARLLPGCAFSIFFLIQKVGPYNAEFLRYLDKVYLETNFFKGNPVS